MVALPGLLFLQAHALVTTHPEAVADWSAHYWNIRRWFFALNFFQPLVAGIALYTVSDRDFPSAEIGLVSLVLVASSLGFASSNERLHGMIAALTFLILVFGWGSIMVQDL